MASIGRIRNVRRLGDSKGANLVEAAIITPLLLLMTFTIVDFAAMFYCYLALEHGVSQATRFAVTGQEMSSGGAPIGREASIKTAMRDATPTLTIPDSAFSFSFMAMNGTSWAGRPRRPERRRPRHCQLQLAVHDAAGSAVLHQRAAQPARAINHEERDAVPMTRPTHRRRTRLHSERGQSIVEFAIVMPLMILDSLGVIETSFALLDQHVVTKLAREGSNLISRDTSLQQAANVLTSMSATPVNFSNGDSTVIFSVLMKGGTTGTTNFGQVVLFQRATFGTYPATSRLTAAGGSYGGPPEYLAANPDNNAGLQVTNVPDSIINVNGGFLYVTEVFTRHNLLTGIDGFLPPLFRVLVPRSLYSIAYF